MSTSFLSSFDIRKITQKDLAEQVLSAIIYRKLRSRRQLHANELEDNNFLYIPKKEPKLILLEKDVIKTNESL